MQKPEYYKPYCYIWQGFQPPVKGWRFCLETMQQKHDAGEIWYPINADGSYDTTKRPYIKSYLATVKGKALINIWKGFN
jgi:hypothetical protein